MSNRHLPENVEPLGQSAPPLSLQASLAVGSEEVSEALRGVNTDPPKMRAGEMLALFLAQLTLFMALVVPMAFSLAIKIGVLDPTNKDALLGLTIGIAGTLVLFTNPLIGVLSDRTRSRFGRRRPWFFGGVLLGTAGSVTHDFAALAFRQPVSEVGEEGLTAHRISSQGDAHHPTRSIHDDDEKARTTSSARSLRSARSWASSLRERSPRSSA